MSNLINLEINDYYLRLLKADLQDKKIKIDNLAFLEEKSNFFLVENNETLDYQRKKIEELINKSKIKDKEVNIIIPNNYSYSQIITMPYLKEKELYSAIKYQADQFIPLPIDKVTVDIDVLHEDKKNNRLIILIVAASNKLIDRITELIEKSGLVPQVIENQASSFSRLISSMAEFKKFENPTLFLNFDFYSSTLYFYHPQLNLITDIFNFKIGLDVFIKEICINFNLEYSKAVEALKTIGFSQNGSLDLKNAILPAFNELIYNLQQFNLAVAEKNNNLKPTQIYIFNLNSHFYLFEKTLQKFIGLPTQILDLSDLIFKNNLFSIFNENKSIFVNLLGSIL